MKEISRRHFMQIAAQVTTAAGLPSTSPVLFAETSASTAASDTRPNVLFIAIDDMSTQVSAFADPAVKTPNMEALARRGVAFDRAYCQFPLCNPSHTSAVLGLRPENSRVLTNDVYWRDRIPNALDLAQHFADHGYDTVAVGKILHATRRGNRGAGWTRVIDASGPSDGTWGRGRDLDGALRDAMRAGKKAPPMALYYQWGPSGLDGEDMMDGRFAAAASRFLGESHTVSHSSWLLVSIIPTFHLPRRIASSTCIGRNPCLFPNSRRAMRKSCLHLSETQSPSIWPGAKSLLNSRAH